ncbi:MAG: hypothetical protein ACPGVG_02210 [Mycobacterium sp.]
MRQLKAPPETLPEMRIEERRVGYGEVDGMTCRDYHRPSSARLNTIRFATAVLTAPPRPQFHHYWDF